MAAHLRQRQRHRHHGGQGYEHEAVAQKMAEQVFTGHYKDVRLTREGRHEKQQTRKEEAWDGDWVGEGEGLYRW